MHVGGRERFAVAWAASCAAVGVAIGVGEPLALPAAAAVGSAGGLVLAGERARGAVAWVALATGTASLLATAAMMLAGGVDPERGAVTGWAVAEALGLGVLTVLAVRYAEGAAAVMGAVACAVAVPAWLLRFGAGPVTTATVGGLAAWGIAAATLVAGGIYLRELDARRVRTVAQARRSQRLVLARDLHDYVAHDLSGILAQAQAGQVLVESDPAAAAHALSRIEQGAQHALAAMDRTVVALHADDEPVSLGPALEELPAVVERFASAEPFDVLLELDGAAVAACSDGAAAGAHRVVIESLTNVRKHARTARQVTVQVRRTLQAGSPALAVTVTDDARPIRTDSRRSRPAFGLAGLGAQVRERGGTLTAGPADPHGWRVSAVLPIDPGPR